MLGIVVADGELAPQDAAMLAAADLVVAANGGARWLEAHGWQPHLVVGDLDSLGERDVARFSEGGVRIRRQPAEKDASDTELAVEEALAAGADRIVLLGAVGGRRLDHELANLLLLIDPALAAHDLRVVRGGTLVRGLRGAASLSLEAQVGDTVTLLPVGGNALGVWTNGLRYPVHGETLAMGRSRGLSNEVTEAPASVRLETGSLLVIEIWNTLEGAQ